MTCSTEVPTDGPGWAEVATCLESASFPHAAARAWWRAWKADPALSKQAISGELRYLHLTGDATMLVEIASRYPGDLDPDTAGHVAWSRVQPGAPDEIEQLGRIGRDTCAYPLAQLELAGPLAALDAQKSRVIALREAVRYEAGGHGLGDDALWQLSTLRAVAVLEVSTVYGWLDRPQNAREYASEASDLVGPYSAATIAWATYVLQDPDAYKLNAEAAKLIPESAPYAVLLAEDPAKEAAREKQRWTDIRARIASWGDDPLAVRPDPFTEPTPIAGYQRSLVELPKEEKAAKGDPAATLLLTEVRGELEGDLREATAEFVGRLLPRIDASLAAIDEAAGGAEPKVRPLWTHQDFGWL